MPIPRPANFSPGRGGSNICSSLFSMCQLAMMSVPVSVKTGVMQIHKRENTEVFPQRVGCWTPLSPCGLVHSEPAGQPQSSHLPQWNRVCLSASPAADGCPALLWATRQDWVKHCRPLSKSLASLLAAPQAGNGTYVLKRTMAPYVVSPGDP